mmetsp:Transcript_24924/g.42993  ORF Transcript_24924/g.42993 Transcript_24924/m.42993 type:complete len:214 (+) Transcript_24924:468-1109(+)
MAMSVSASSVPRKQQPPSAVPSSWRSCLFFRSAEVSGVPESDVPTPSRPRLLASAAPSLYAWSLLPKVQGLWQPVSRRSFFSSPVSRTCTHSHEDPRRRSATSSRPPSLPSALRTDSSPRSSGRRPSSPKLLTKSLLISLRRAPKSQQQQLRRPSAPRPPSRWALRHRIRSINSIHSSPSLGRFQIQNAPTSEATPACNALRTRRVPVLCFSI